MFRHLARTSRTTARLVNTRSVLTQRSITPLISRLYFSSNGYYYEEPQPSKVVCFLLGATAAAGAIYFVKPNKPKPKKIEETPVIPTQEKIVSIEPPITEEILIHDEPVVETSDMEPIVNEEPVIQEEVTVVDDNAIDSVINPEENSIADIDNGSSDVAEVLASQINNKNNDIKKSNTDIAEKENIQLGELEEETKKESAYNPDTGEINWDCPCLGGMAHGPCGEEFKEAFSCFIYSEAEPKGIDCVEKFQGMQTCFRKYPEYYAEQLKDEEDAETVMQSEEFAQTNDDSTVPVVPEETVNFNEQQEKDEPFDLVEEIELTESD
ncbi:similar to Saccharomyces cerevisiae YKL195W MIA40 Essential protein of the mitochondrial intermembrane space (IMS) [Maudiozyma saulgeensis]|uniref:Mitochondrial intermembrane space import and assembly protein 40 n=1 Tax=Maudiozyma saulgeensis TaxID=1789683 RepID=A0A1X7R9Q8_9SACH|nr:similar to Saccharomyces cerevisiae YKL195W MIA40 Essential protein of the mitochondrial intermembrane space (IMS) [Kazachstania saulgeensis]